MSRPEQDRLLLLIEQTASYEELDALLYAILALIPIEWPVNWEDCAEEAAFQGLPLLRDIIEACINRAHCLTAQEALNY